MATLRNEAWYVTDLLSFSADAQVIAQKMLDTLSVITSDPFKTVVSDTQPGWPYADADTDEYNLFTYYTRMEGLSAAESATLGIPDGVWEEISDVFFPRLRGVMFSAARISEAQIVKERLCTWRDGDRAPVPEMLAAADVGDTSLERLVDALFEELYLGEQEAPTDLSVITDGSDFVWNAKRRILLTMVGNSEMDPTVTDPNGPDRTATIWPYRTETTALSASGYVAFLDAMDASALAALNLVLDDVADISRFADDCGTVVSQARIALDRWDSFRKIAAADVITTATWGNIRIPQDPELRYALIQGDLDRLALSAEDTDTTIITVLPVVSIGGPADATEGASFDFTLHRTGPTTDALSVNLRIDTVDRVVVIAAGLREASVSHTVPEDADTMDGPDITATILAGTGYLVGAPSTLTVAVADDDDPAPVLPVITLQTPIGAVEGTTFTLSVSSNIAAPSALSVNVRIVSGSITQTIAVAIAAGSSTGVAMYTVPQDADTTDGPNVVVTILPGTGYVLGAPSGATVLVTDDDEVAPALPVVTITGPAVAVEGATITYVIHRTGSTASRLWVNVNQNGTSVRRFIDGSNRSLSYTIPEDDDMEDGPPVILSVGESDDYATGSPSTVTVQVTDNDEPPPVPVPMGWSLYEQVLTVPGFLPIAVPVRVEEGEVFSIWVEWAGGDVPSSTGALAAVVEDSTGAVVAYSINTAQRSATSESGFIGSAAQPYRKSMGSALAYSSAFERETGVYSLSMFAPYNTGTVDISGTLRIYGASGPFVSAAPVLAPTTREFTIVDTSLTDPRFVLHRLRQTSDRPSRAEVTISIVDPDSGLALTPAQAPAGGLSGTVRRRWYSRDSFYAPTELTSTDTFSWHIPAGQTETDFTVGTFHFTSRYRCVVDMLTVEPVAGYTITVSTGTNTETFS